MGVCESLLEAVFPFTTLGRKIMSGERADMI